MLNTDRLLLRPHRVQDREPYARLWATATAPDPRGVPQLDLTPEDAWSRLLRFIGHRTVFGFSPFLVVEMATGDLVGEVGYGYFHRGFGPEYDQAPEAMWKTAHEREGSGFASEAMTAATAHLDGCGLGARSVCVIDHRNTPSVRIAERLGFERFAEADYRSARRALFVRIRQAK